MIVDSKQDSLSHESLSTYALQCITPETFYLFSILKMNRTLQHRIQSASLASSSVRTCRSCVDFAFRRKGERQRRQQELEDRCSGFKCDCSSNSRDLWYREDGKSGEDLLALLRETRSRSSSGKDTRNNGSGTVYLVGTGPGDPELLTLKAVRLMREADVVLYDRLVSEDILEMVNPKALMVYVGKQKSYHTRSQAEIHELMQIFATELGTGATVVRLKGGDPYVFGRGGEEVEYLGKLGVQAHSIPGITAAAGIAADLGIPLTHRGLATSVRFMTGHAREGGQSDIDSAMATAFDTHTTLVIYMGLGTLERTVDTLITGGLPKNTPAVAVEKGTTPEQRTVWSTLEQLFHKVDEAKLVSPTLIIIGNVVSLSKHWVTESNQYSDVRSPQCLSK